jgi:LacI family transcriptional regulator
MPGELTAMAKRVGIADVARAAGVSLTTVSHVLSDQGSVSASTRANVRKVAAELGYTPNRIASALRLQRSGIIGFVSDEIATTPFAGRIVLGAQDAAAERGMLLMMVNSNGDATVESRQIESLLAQQVDAVIYARMSHREVSLPQSLSAMPTVLLNAEDLLSETYSVVPNEHQIATTAIEYLVAAGHRRIVHISITESGPATDGRAAGYRDAMLQHGLDPVVVEVGPLADARAGREGLDRAFEAQPDLTAVFCFNDPIALGVYQAAYRRNLSVPEDLSVVGVDNLEIIASQILPGLTTVALPHYEMGRLAVSQLYSITDGADSAVASSPRVRLHCKLVERESVAPPRADPTISSENLPPRAHTS